MHVVHCVPRCPVAHRSYPGSVIAWLTMSKVRLYCQVMFDCLLEFHPNAISLVNRLRQVRYTWFRQVHIYVDQGYWGPRYMLWFRFPDFPSVWSVTSELRLSTSVTGSLVPIYCQISVRQYSTAVDTSVRCGYVSLDSGYDVLCCTCKVPGEVHGCHVQNSARCRVQNRARCRM